MNKKNTFYTIAILISIILSIQSCKQPENIEKVLYIDRGQFFNADTLVIDSIPNKQVMPIIFKNRQVESVKQKLNIDSQWSKIDYNLRINIIPKLIKPKIQDKIAISYREFTPPPPTIIEAKEAVVRDHNPYSFSYFSINQGLNSSQIRHVTSDNNGYLWLASDYGLVRFDGKFFHHFNNDHLLPSSLILHLMFDNKNSMWISTFRGGLLRYDGDKFYSYSSKNGFIDDIVNQTFQDSKGYIWVATHSGLVKIDGDYMLNFTQQDGLSGKDVRYVNEDNNGRIWVATADRGLTIIDEDNFLIIDQSCGLPSNYVDKIFKDSQGRMWIVMGSNGLAIYDGNEFIKLSKESGLPSNMVQDVYEDNVGNIWVSYSDAGVSLITGNDIFNYTEHSGVPTSYIRCTYQDRFGNMWFGSRNSGLIKFSGNTVTHLSKTQGLSGDRVISLFYDQSDIWAGTFGDYVTKISIDSQGMPESFTVIDRDFGLLSNKVYDILKDSKGNYWFSCDGGGIVRFDGQKVYHFNSSNGIDNLAVRDLFEDRDGNIWISTYGGGVIKYSGSNFSYYNKEVGLPTDNILVINQDLNGNILLGTEGQGFVIIKDSLIINYSANNDFLSNTIYDIYVDENNNYWLASAQAGLILYDGDRFKSISVEYGLSSNYAYSIVRGEDQDKNMTLWVGTRDGLNRLSIDQNLNIDDVRAIKYSDDFYGTSCNSRSIVKAKNRIYVGTGDRLSIVNFSSPIFKDLPFVSKVEINSVNLFNEYIDWRRVDSLKSLTLKNGIVISNPNIDSIKRWNNTPIGLKLKHNNNYISFVFKYINLFSSQRVEYRYMLEGLNSEWNTPITNNVIHFGNLSPNRYNLRIQVLKNGVFDGVELNYPFTIKAPFWQTPFFILFSLLFLILCILFFIQYRIRKIKKERYNLQIIVQEKTKELLEKNSDLEINNKNKDRLISIIAHDLKTPFSGFLGLTSLLKEEGDSLDKDDIKSIAENMNKSANNLYYLLENILYWARSQQNTITVNSIDINLLQEISYVLTQLSGDCSSKNIEVSINVNSTTSIKFDRDMFHVIIRNIVSNAIKFSNRDSKIDIKSQISNGYTILSITDYGVGIDSNLLSNIFDNSDKKGRVGTAGEKSTGLGLIICRDFMKMNGGSINIESEDSKGTTVNLKFII